jgi:hypothetical protein
MQRSSFVALAGALAIASSLYASGPVVASGPTVNTYLWHRGTKTNIGGLTPTPQFVESGGMNDLAQIAGTTLSPTLGNFAGFVWQQGHMTELPSPPGCPESQAATSPNP